MFKKGTNFGEGENKKVPYKLAFTLVELIVVITILAVLGVISFLSFQGYVLSARDGTRIADLKNIQSALEYTKVDLGYYILPDNSTPVMFSGATVWNQGTFGKDSNMKTDSLNKVPTDPLTGGEYTLSVLNNGLELELGTILESNEIIHNSVIGSTYADISEVRAYLAGDYNGQVAKVSTGGIDYVLAIPSIINSDATENDIMSIITNRKLAFKGYSNIPHSYGLDNGEVRQENITFVNPDELVVFSGSFDILKDDESERINLLVNMQKAYSGTVIQNKGQIKDISSVEIDINNPSIIVRNLVINIVNFRFISRDEDKLTLIGGNNGGDSGEEESGILPSDLVQVFAAESVFTENWQTNNCDPNNISVVNLAPGTDVIPQTLAANTIYKLDAGDYVMNGSSRNMFSCSAIIGEPGQTKLYGGSANSNRLTMTDNTILYGVDMDGENDGDGGTHTKNYYSLYPIGDIGSTIMNVNIYNSNYGMYVSDASYLTVNKVNAFNNSSTGINIYRCSNSVFENVNSYNNQRGIVLYAHSNQSTLPKSKYNIFQNINTYNNDVTGLGVGMYSENNAFININSFNNSYHGISWGNRSDTNIISNINLFNNAQRGVDFYDVRYNIFNQLKAYNNGTHGVSVNGFSNKYYNVLENFSNVSGTFNGTSGQDGKIGRGYGPFLGWDTGSVESTNVFDDSWTVIPSTSGWDYSLRGKQALSFDGSETYTYGSNIANQTQPLKWNGTAFELYGLEGEDYDSSKKVGEW